ncbi:hypothetical protein Glove_54g26 [Diversispora epigaea]|uniref:Uncharacterized protein n=1 Tax=Diversispora epigaea TaxID=1348612 RepID=A0A397JCV4_9GLOM|nr:hypothetical protein Glove_54g26 [Diversispora epigaea]
MANLSRTLFARSLHLRIPQNSAKFRRLSTPTHHSPLEQMINYSLKEFLHEYEKRSKENQENMKEDMRNIVEQRISSAENKFLYLIVVGVIAGLTKSWYDRQPTLTPTPAPTSTPTK